MLVLAFNVKRLDEREHRHKLCKRKRKDERASLAAIRQVPAVRGREEEGVARLREPEDRERHAEEAEDGGARRE